MIKVIQVSRCLLLASFLFLYSCKKNTEEVKSDNMQSAQKADAAVISKVTAWLEQQQLLYADNKSLKIDSLKKALITSNAFIENYKENKKLVIVPVGNGFKSANNLDKDPANYLVVVLDNGLITQGNIVKYIPANGQKQLPSNTFSKIFTYQKLEFDGQFSILNLADELFLHLKFKNGRLNSVAERRSKPLANFQARTTTCINWYIVTTWYDVYGNVEQVTEDFLFSTGCGDDSQPSGPGGSGGDNIVYEYSTTRTKTWDVYTTPDSKNIVESTEELQGNRNGDSSVFSNIVHKGSDVRNIVENGPSDYNYAIWHSDPWSKTIAPNKKTGTTSIKGLLTYELKPEHNVPPTTKTWTAKTDL